MTLAVDATGAELLSTASNAATAVAVVAVCVKILNKTWATGRKGGSRGMIKGLRADLAKVDAGLKALKAELRSERAAKKSVERVPCDLSAGLVSRREALVPWQIPCDSSFALVSRLVSRRKAKRVAKKGNAR